MRHFILFSVILLVLVCTIQLAEGFENYDTDNDRTQQYTASTYQYQDEDTGILSDLTPQGLMNSLGRLLYGDEAGSGADQNQLAGLCDSYNALESCGSLANRGRSAPAGEPGHSNHWNFDGGRHGLTSYNSGNLKDQCTTCAMCHGGQTFVPEYYGWYCDALRSCVDDPTKPNTKPFIYAVNSVDWDRHCPEDGGDLNYMQRFTCMIFTSFLGDMFDLYTMDQSAGCAVDVTEDELEQVCDENSACSAVGDALGSAGDILSDLF